MEQERKAKHDAAKRQFEQFQTEYNSLLQSPTPATPVFSEQMEEEKITMKTMDELLKWQQEMRERDIGLVGPPPSTAPSESQPNPIQKLSISPKDELETIKHEIIEIISAKTQDESLQRDNMDGAKPKQVSWA